MQLRQIHLIRHGESTANVDPKVYTEQADDKIELTEKGCEQARLLGQSFAKKVRMSSRFIQPYVSPYERAKQTYRKFREGFGPEFENIFLHPLVDDRVREREWGDYRAYAKGFDPELLERQHEYFFRMPGGESVADVTGRVSSFMLSVFQDDPEVALVFSHGDFIKAFTTRFFRLDPRWYETNEVIGNAKELVIILTGTGWICNYHGHVLTTGKRGYDL